MILTLPDEVRCFHVEHEVCGEISEVVKPFTAVVPETHIPGTQLRVLGGLYHTRSCRLGRGLYWLEGGRERERERVRIAQ